MKARALIALARAAALNVHHKRALAVLAAVTLLDVVSGVILAVIDHVPAWHGVYCTIGTTTTVGCDLPLHGGAAYAMSTVAMVLFVPLWATAFSFFTTGLTADHVEVITVKQTDTVARITEKQTAELKEHVSDTARNP